MASSANQENKKVVGYGSSSCTFRPPLNCSERNIKLRNNINKSRVISQITDLASADLKVNMVHKLRLSGLEEKLLNKYFILTPLPLESNLKQKDLRRGESLPLRQCTPNINSETLKKLEPQCPIYEKFLHQPNRMLYFNNGGNDLEKLKKEEELQYYINWLANFLNIFEGVKLLIDNNVIHFDIKRANIISNPSSISGIGFRLIDFDMAKHITDLNDINNCMWFDFLNDNIWKKIIGVALVIPLNCYLIYCFKIIEMKKRRDNGKRYYDNFVLRQYPNLEGLLSLDDNNPSQFKEQLKNFFRVVLTNFSLFLNNPYLTNKCLLGFYTEFFGGIDSFKQSKLEQFYEVIDNFDSNTSREQLNKIYRHIDLYSIGLCLLEFCFQNNNGYKLREEGRNYIQETILQFIIHNKLLNQDLIPDDNFNIDIVIRNYNILLQLLQTDYENALVNYQLMMAAQPQPQAQAQPQLVAAAEEAQTPEIIYLQYVELASLKEKEIFEKLNNYTMLVQLAQESASKEPQFYLYYMNMVRTSAFEIATEQESYINYIRLAGEKAIEIGTIAQQYYQSSYNEQFNQHSLQYIQLAKVAEVNLERAQQIYLHYISLVQEAEAEIQRISHQSLQLAASNNTSSHMNMTGGFKKSKKFKKSIKKTLKKHFIKGFNKSKKHKKK